MRIIAGAIRNPVAIGVTVLLISLFGALSLKQLPLQLQQAQVRHRVAQHDLDQTEVRVPCPASSPSAWHDAASMSAPPMFAAVTAG